MLGGEKIGDVSVVLAIGVLLCVVGLVLLLNVLGAAGAGLGVDGSILTQYHLINAVDATILTAAEPLLGFRPLTVGAGPVA